MHKRIIHLLHKLTGRFKKRSIQVTICLSFTLVAVVGMVGLSTLIYFRSVYSSEQMMEEDNKRLVAQVNKNLDGFLRDMMRVSDASYYNVIKNADLQKDDITKQLNLLYDTNRSLISGIGLFSQYGEALAAVPLSQLKKGVNPREQAWFQKAVKKTENMHFSTPHVQNLFRNSEGNYRWVVSLSRSAEITKNREITHGVLLVDISFSGIEQIFKGVNLSKNGYVYLTDASGEIIYHPRQQLIYSDLQKENNYVNARYDDGSHMENFSGIKRMVIVKTVGYTGWKIIGVSPMSDFAESQGRFLQFVFFLMLFSVFLLFFMNQFLSYRIARPIQCLEKSVQQLEQGKLDTPISISGSYEVQHLGKTIRSMAQQMQTLMRDIVEEQEEKRKSELDALQSQINPHFLYNTLDSIIWMIENERYDGAVTMVTALARFFRISLSGGNSIIPIQKEIEHARNYLTIQNIRFKNKFVYHIHAEPDTLMCATIKLIIQPLVENAIYHGVEYMDGDGEICVLVYRKQNDLYIDISDNGMGIPEENIPALLSGEDRENFKRSKGSGIGIWNVQQRIQLYFGKNYGLSILSRQQEGTTIQIHIPAVPYTSEEDFRRDSKKNGKYKNT